MAFVGFVHSSSRSIGFNSEDFTVFADFKIRIFADFKIGGFLLILNSQFSEIQNLSIRKKNRGFRIS